MWQGSQKKKWELQRLWSFFLSLWYWDERRFYQIKSFKKMTIRLVPLSSNCYYAQQSLRSADLDLQGYCNKTIHSKKLLLEENYQCHVFYSVSKIYYMLADVTLMILHFLFHYLLQIENGKKRNGRFMNLIYTLMRSKFDMQHRSQKLNRLNFTYNQIHFCSI